MRCAMIVPAVASLLLSCAATPTKTGTLAWYTRMGAPELELGRDQTDAVNALKGNLQTSLLARDLPRAKQLMPEFDDILREWEKTCFSHEDGKTEVQLSPVFAIGTGILSDLAFQCTSVTAGVYAWLPFNDGVYVVRDSKGQWLIKPPYIPELSVPRLVKQEGRVTIIPGSDRFEADIAATVMRSGMTVIPFELALRTQGLNVTRARGLGVPSQRLQILAVTQDGQACQYKLMADRLVIRPAKLDDTVRIRVQYQGETSQDGFDHINAKDLVLRREARWLPTLPATLANYDLVIKHPDSFNVFGPGRQEGPKPAAPGWVESRFSLSNSDNFTLYGGPNYVKKTTKVAAVDLTTALWPEHAQRTDAVVSQVQKTLDALNPLLGPYPASTLRVVETGFGDGTASYGPLTNVTFGWKTILDGLSPLTTAHTLSYGWFRGMVIPSPEALLSGSWPDSLAAFVSSMTVDDATADKLHEQWSNNYVQVPAAKDRPVLDAGLLVGPDLRKTIAQNKAPLVLLTWLDQVGRDKVAATFKTFLKQRAGKLSTWENFLMAVGETCGGEAQGSLRRWMTSPTAPDLHFGDIAIGAREITGRVISTGNLGLSGRVELGFFQGNRLLGLETITFTPTGGSFTLARREGADRLVIDPRHRLARRYNPAEDPFKTARQLRLATTP